MKEFGIDTDMSIDYRETNSVIAISNVSDHLNDIAVIRYNEIYEDYFVNSLKEHDLDCKLLWKFDCVALMSHMHPLAKMEIIPHEELSNFTRIVHGDTTVPDMQANQVRRLMGQSEIKKYISVYERGSQFEILSKVTTAYIWTSKVPEDTLKRFLLVQKKSDAKKNNYKDIIIFRKGYKFKETDEIFCSKLYDITKILTEM